MLERDESQETPLEELPIAELLKKYLLAFSNNINAKFQSDFITFWQQSVHFQLRQCQIRGHNFKCQFISYV